MTHHEHHDLEDEDFDDEERGPSKSQLKRDAHELVELGRRLAELPAQQLAQVPLSDDAREAVIETRSVTAHGARKRQLKHLGRLLNREEVEPIRAALEKFAGRHTEAVAQHHQCERWRDRLLAEGDTALGQLLEQHPDVDRQALRQLIRNAQQELAQGRPPKASRELFRRLREILG